MEHQKPKVAAVDLVAKSQLALIHAASARPTFDWSVIQHLMHLWLATNAARYRSADVEFAHGIPGLRPGSAPGQSG